MIVAEAATGVVDNAGVWPLGPTVVTGVVAGVVSAIAVAAFDWIETNTIATLSDSPITEVIIFDVRDGIPL